jgi:hypothetical protein
MIESPVLRDLLATSLIGGEQRDDGQAGGTDRVSFGDALAVCPAASC